jgi:hypothetical protein
VYKQVTSTGETVTKDQICIATTDKQLYFYDGEFKGGQYKFEEDKRSHIIANRPVQMCKLALLNPYQTGTTT